MMIIPCKRRMRPSQADFHGTCVLASDSRPESNPSCCLSDWAPACCDSPSQRCSALILACPVLAIEGKCGCQINNFELANDEDTNKSCKCFSTYVSNRSASDECWGFSFLRCQTFRTTFKLFQISSPINWYNTCPLILLVFFFHILVCILSCNRRSNINLTIIDGIS